MKRIWKIVTCVLALAMITVSLAACDGSSYKDMKNTMTVANRLQNAQPTPTDINYSLERHNLIRRAYLVNGQREKANALVCPVEKPLGYVALYLEGVGLIDTYVVDGKVSSLNSFLTPDSERYSGGEYSVEWVADVDGSYGENDNGIFFFTVDGHYVEWTGVYRYSDTPIETEQPVVNHRTVG